MNELAVPYSRTIVGGLPWYSVLVVTGIVLAVWLASREEKRLGLPKDTTVELALVIVPCGIVGARLYYVLMSWEQFSYNPVSALFIWQGGLAIYGGVIGGALGALVYAYRKKIHFKTLADMVAPGLLLAQAIGRWGNYFNMEAYGTQITDESLQFFPLAVYIPANQAWYAATFFYESVWNFIGFAALWLMRKKIRSSGCVFAWYLIIYGSGRFIIEQLRQDSLYVGNLRASQWLSLVLCALAALYVLYVAYQKNKKEYWLCAGCALLWLMRWGMLENEAYYAVLFAVAGVMALRIVYKNKKALFWLCAALMLDFAGIMAAVLQWPMANLAVGIQAALCSLTFLIGIWALCTRTE